MNAGKKRLVAFGASAIAIAASPILACTSTETRPIFVDDESEASLPETGPSLDEGSIPRDAATEKPPFDPADEPVTCTTAPCAVEIVAGENHFCARMSDGTARCWGDDRRGSRGGGEDAGESVGVVQVAGVTGATQLSAGGTSTCALVADGAVACWGGNHRAQLGLDSAAPIADSDRHPTPTRVALPSPAKRVDVGPASACAVLASGEVWCWGDNGSKQLARETTDNLGAPAKAELGELRVTRTAIGTFTAFAVSDTGDVFSWGAVAGAEGSIAARETSISPDPSPLPIGLRPATSFSVSSTTLIEPDFPKPERGIAHACAIVNGDVDCWGDSQMGATGAATPGQVPAPRRAEIAAGTAWPQRVAAGGDITCVRVTSGAVQCAGDNSYGALGRDPKIVFSLLFQPAETGGAHAVQLAVASHSVCALIQGGTVICWGSNERGELGQLQSDGDPHATPVQVRF